MSRLQELRAALQNNDTSSVSDTVYRSVYDQVKSVTDTSQSTKAVKTEQIVTPQETPVAVRSLLDYYIRVTGSFARLSGDMLTQNILVTMSGLPEDVRVISLESIMWLAGHFGELMAALILNYENIQQVVIDALSNELDLLKLSQEERVKRHDTDEYPMFDLNNHCMELGLTEFTTETQLMIAERITESIHAFDNTELSKSVDQALSLYEQKDADDIGAILSNPVYLLIICNYNGIFMNTLNHIVVDLKAASHI